MIRIVTNSGGATGGGGGSMIGMPVYVQRDQPSTSDAALWWPLNGDRTPKTLDEVQIFVPEFNPGVPLSGVYAWYSAPGIDDLTDGDAVGQWNDLSGNGRHLTQATPSKQPIYTAGVQNGQPVVRFTEANLTALSKASLSISQPFEIFAVFRIRTDANTSKTNILVAGGGASLQWDLKATGGSRAVQMAFTTTRGSSNTSLPATWNAWRFIVDGANSEILATSADTVLFGPSSPGTTGLSSITIGSASANLTDIDWGELIITNRRTTTPERAAVASYLTGLWGTA